MSNIFKADFRDFLMALIHYQHLLQAKRAAGRPRDQNDLDHLLGRN